MAKPRPEQITAVCKVFHQLWQKYPQLRFGQVVAIIAARAGNGDNHDLFYVLDKQIFNQIRTELKK